MPASTVVPVAERIDMGVHTDRDPIEAEIVALNQGDSAVVVAPGRASCGCIQFKSQDPKIVAPGVKATFGIVIDPTGRDGDFSFVVQLDHGPEAEPVFYTIEGRIDPILRLKPARVFLESTTEAARAAQAEVEVTSDVVPLEQCRILPQKSSVPGIKMACAWGDDESPDRRTVHLTLLPETQLGQYVTKVPLAYDKGEEGAGYTRDILVLAKMTSTRIKEFGIFFGVQNWRSDATASATLTTSGGAVIYRVDGVPDFINCAIAEDGRRADFSMRINDIPPGIPLGPYSKQITVHFRGGGDGVNVPVQFYLLKRHASSPAPAQ